MSFNRWMDIEGVFCTMEYYSAIRKDEYLLFTLMWLELESIMVSEISQPEKDNYLMISLICAI